MFFDGDTSHFFQGGISNKEIEPEEIFSDNSFLPEAYDTIGDPNRKLEVPVSFWVSMGMQIIVFATIVFFGLYISYLIFFRGDQYKALAQQNIQHVFVFPAARGQILDRNGQVLATTIPGFQLELQLRVFNGDDKTTHELAAAIAHGNPEQTSLIENQIKYAQRKHLDRIVLLKNITLDELPDIHKRTDKFSGLFYRDSFIRSYPYGPATAHVLGYTGDPNSQDLAENSQLSSDSDIGKDGIEVFYDASLQGTPGKAATLVDSKGDILGEEVLQQASAGQDLHTTLDADLQKISYDTLLQHLQKQNLQKGVVVAMDPRDGSVRALVSLPSFDPNAFAKGISAQDYNTLQSNSAQPLFDRAIAGTYPSGSVIKPLLASAALEENIISPNKVLYTNGSISIPSIYDPSVIYTFHDWKNNGAVDMRRAIAVSDDIYFYTIGGGYGDQQGLGVTRIDKYLHIFGWGQKTGVDLPGESSGFVPDPQWKKNTNGENWFIGDTYHLSIGQGGLLTTPLQVASSIAAIANGGTLYQPHILQERNPSSVKLPFPQDILQVAQQGMREAVVDGTSQILKDLPFDAAGKTGTAQTVSGVNTHAWFVAYAPYENPTLVIVVLMENAGEGTEATHVANEILQKYQGLTK